MSAVRRQTPPRPPSPVPHPAPPRPLRGGHWCCKCRWRHEDRSDQAEGRTLTLNAEGEMVVKRGERKERNGFPKSPETTARVFKTVSPYDKLVILLTHYQDH
ncbi:hypothetical protein E2C01_090298 [Portunus trituberculatus]|uniref:Uncharacterized protein n=1 Tax=Portunus trituberculatus TaxID=210409 RepID=A0A5B7JG19_PORTR|nr:hypothetical protein [Portunus trituberculatus]